MQPGLWDEFDADESGKRKPTADDARRAEQARRNGGDQVRRAAAGLPPLRLPETPPGGATAGEIRDEAVERVGRNNAADRDWYYRTALIVIARGQPFTTEHVVAEDPELEAVREKKVFGNAMSQLKREGLITPTEQFVSGTRKICHAGPKRVWQPTGKLPTPPPEPDPAMVRNTGPPGELGATATVCQGQEGPAQPGGG